MVPACRAVVSNARVRRKAQCRTLSAASIYSSLHPGKDGLGVRATFQARGALVGLPCAGALLATLHVRATLPGVPARNKY